MVFDDRKKNAVYFLGYPRDDGTVAVLCRNSGSMAGPAYCESKKDAIKLKTRLVNDPRSLNNHRAMEIIKGLYVYKLYPEIEPAWEPGLLWAYLPTEKVKCVEFQNFW